MRDAAERTAEVVSRVPEAAEKTSEYVADEFQRAGYHGAQCEPVGNRSDSHADRTHHNINIPFISSLSDDEICARFGHGLKDNAALQSEVKKYRETTHDAVSLGVGIGIIAAGIAIASKEGTTTEVSRRKVMDRISRGIIFGLTTNLVLFDKAQQGVEAAARYLEDKVK